MHIRDRGQKTVRKGQKHKVGRTSLTKTSVCKRPPLYQRTSVEVDIESLLSFENRCTGCARGERCCCSSYEVCATAAEVKRIIRILPEAAKYCPHLLTAGGYDNVFEEEEPGLFSIDTNEDGLCLFAYRSDGEIRCSLHTVAATLGLPLEQVKPKVCLLWPMHFSDGDEVLGIISDASRFSCNIRKAAGSRTLSPGFVEAIELVYGEGCGAQAKLAAENGQRRTLLITRR
ncbi:MAG: hypothetical protein ACM32I_07950 [Nitrospirota bacterium]|jgi:hypothetical protein